MKISKKTRRRIIKAFMFARGLFLGLFALFIFLAIGAAGAENIMLMLWMTGAALLCFVISIFCDQLLGSYKSPFCH